MEMFLNDDSQINNINNKLFNFPTKNSKNGIQQVKNYHLFNQELIADYFKKNPEIISNFELLDFLNYGSSNTYIYTALEKQSKKKVIIKMSPKRKEMNHNINEIIISQKLKNKNIINCNGFRDIKKNEIDYIIMEYAKYGSLLDFKNKLLKKQYFSEQLLCFFTSQILNGLKYCHMCKIAHLDIKPKNIVIDDYLTAKIIDFSVSLDYSKINSNKIKLPFRGTSFYMAPEVLSSKIVKVKDLNKVDLFSLGVTLYALAFGKYPFGFTPDDDYEKIYKKIMKGIEIEDTKYYSKYFIDFLTKLLEKDINKRININEALNHYWIKGAQLLNNEKEKTDDLDIFLSYLIGDNIKSFRDYLYALN